MKTLFLTREQAKKLGEFLCDYSTMRVETFLFKGFQINYNDPMAEKVDGDLSIDIMPIPASTILEDFHDHNEY